MKAVLYARVSSSSQEKDQTIQSQLEALRKYAKEKGYEIIDEYIDEGYSGATLERPGLDKLRDIIHSGEIDTALFHSPDRLARKAVYQGIVLEEMDKAGIRAEFMNQHTDDSPESRMLLGMQGLFSEYERAKFSERSRRGKMHWAKQGVLVSGRVPYGYRRIHRDRENGTRGRMVIAEEEAIVVKDMFRLLIDEQLSCRQIAKKLNTMGIPTRKGLSRWAPGTVNQILRKTAYMGVHYQRCKEAIEPSRTRTGGNHQRRFKSSTRLRPKEEWIPISVPAIFDESVWQAAQRQLDRNSRHSRRNNTRFQYLLKGLIRCPHCDWTYTGFVSHEIRKYRCGNHEPLKSKDGKRCIGGAVRADMIEEAIWEAICEGLKNPKVLQDEYKRRLIMDRNPDAIKLERKKIESELKKIFDKQDRLLDLYLNKAIDLNTYKPKMNEMSNTKSHLENQLDDLDRRTHNQYLEEKALKDMKKFCKTICNGLDKLSFDEKQQLLRLLVERIELRGNKAFVDIIFPIEPLANQTGDLRHCIQ